MPDDSGLILVRAFSRPHEAHLACSALRAAGIRALLADDHIVDVNWLYSNAVGGVKVLVPVEDAAAAQTVLAVPAQIEADAADSATAPGTEAAACPRCGSDDSISVIRGRRLLFLGWLVVGFPVIPLLRRRKCRACGYRFGSNRPA